jgi:hypothetical protein
MNKFWGPDDRNYGRVLGKIVDIVNHAFDLAGGGECLKMLKNKLPCGEDTEALQKAKEVLHVPTSSWIFDDTVYLRWKRREGSSVLQIAGEPGTGKTMLIMALVREYLQQNQKPGQHDTVMAYFFFREGNDAAGDFFRRVIYQLVHDYPERRLGNIFLQEWEDRRESLFESDKALREVLERMLTNITLVVVSI